MNRCQRTEWITSGIIAVSFLLMNVLIPHGHFTGTGLDLIVSILCLGSMLGLTIAYIIRGIIDIRGGEENKLHLTLRFILPPCIYALDTWLKSLNGDTSVLFIVTGLIIIMCNVLYILYYGHSSFMWATLALYNVSSWIYFLMRPKTSLILLFPSVFYVELLVFAIAVGYTEYFVRVMLGLIRAPEKAARPRKEHKKKAAKEAPRSDKDSANKAKEVNGFACGVEAVFALKDTEDVVVTGHVKGTVSEGMEVRVLSFDDDSCEEYPARIISLEKDRTPVSSATDCAVGIKLTGVSTDKLPVGCVICSDEATSDLLLWAFGMGLAYEYVERRDMDLTEEEWEKLPIGHLIETASVYMAKMGKTPASLQTDEYKLKSRMKVDRLVTALVKKVLSADELYVVFSRLTGEPYMVTRAYMDTKNSQVAPPTIMLSTKGFERFVNRTHTDPDMELKLIRNAEDNGKGIYDLLGRAFYLNGACGININGSGFNIMNDLIISEPDYKDTPKKDIPVTNPDLVRWLLLLGQLRDSKDPNKAALYGIFYGFVLREIPKASFLVPMQKNGEFPQPDENGKIVLPEGAKMSFAACPGKDGRTSICMFTDWYRLRQGFDESWDGMVVKIGDLIERNDCSVNPVKEHLETGLYVSKAVFEKAVSMLKSF